MPNHALPAMAALLWALPIAAQGLANQAEAFDAGLGEVHALMAKAKWSDASQALLDLLAEHQDAVYAQAQSDAVRHDFRTCRFFEQATIPAIADLLAGKVASWSASSGKIKLIYEGHLEDWEGEAELLVHPIVFAGDYTLAVSGERHPIHESTRLFFDLAPNGAEIHIADFGFAQERHGNATRSMSATVERRDATATEVLAKGKSKVKGNKPFTLSVRVSERTIDCLYNKQSMLKVKRDAASLGHVGLLKADYEEVVLEGKVEPSWLESRIDEQLAKQREAFDRSFDARQELPQWLFERPRIKRTTPRASSWLPGRTDSAELGAVLAQWRAGKLAEAEAGLADLTDDHAEPVTRWFIAASLLLASGRPESALPVSQQLIDALPESSQSRMLHAEVLDALGESERGLEEIRAALAADPGEERVYERLVVALMRRGQNAEAARTVRAGKVEHGLWKELAGLDTMLAMAERGPAFARRHSYKTRHYEVVSDIDRKVCQQACAILEASYVNLMAQFSWVREQKGQPLFQVFLFAGESGYQDYCKAILGSAVPHTAGLYSPVLKQLLIWNVPRRDDMERTIRHEGFHQFLDRLMEHPPTWLNEGTAEFWETAQRENGRFVGGQVRGDHIATLIRSRKLVPTLQEFAYGGRGDFYANAQLRYAQGWALVHFLREGDRRNQERFDKLWDALRASGSTRAALDTAFAGIDWAGFENEFWAHLESLGR